MILQCGSNPRSRWVQQLEEVGSWPWWSVAERHNGIALAAREDQDIYVRPMGWVVV